MNFVIKLILFVSSFAVEPAAIMSWCHIYYLTSIILCIYSGYIAASEYYVTADSNGLPSDWHGLPCHNLSYYVVDFKSYFTNDTIFYFLEGTHTLQVTLEISGISNITLQGLGDVEQGFHETVMQSTSVILCSGNTRAGIKFTTSTNVAVKSLTIINCGFLTFVSSQANPRSAYVSLFFVDIDNTTLEWVSVQNASVYGLCIVNSFDVLIANSTFANNRGLTSSGNAYIAYDDRRKGPFRVNIMKSNFTLGSKTGMDFWYFYNNEAEVIIENCYFSHNIVGYGGGVYIESRGNGTIEFRNCAMYNNTALIYGGGVYIRSYGYGNIEFHNSTIHDNIALQYGGGVYFRLHGGGSFEFDKCALYNNTALKYGGGVFIDTYGTSSIEYHNCTIYNNTARYDGGGVYIDLYEGVGRIEYHNCSVYKNAAQYDGGGVHIDLYEGRSRVEFYDCTILKNIAYLGSGLYLRSLHATLTASSFYFENVLFHFNKATNKLALYRKIYQSAVVLFNIANVIFDQIEVSNHITTGIVCFNSRITFDGHSRFLNNSGINGGGIALYESSHLLLNKHINKTLNISFFNNHASVSGGGMFVSQVVDVDRSTDCSFEVIPHHSYYNSSPVFYFVNNTAAISGDILYGGNVEKCYKEDEFKNLFHYSQQTGLSVVSSDPIKMCFCQSDKQNCSIKNINITAIPGIDINISLATVGAKDGLTEGVIKLTSLDSSTTRIRLNAKCTNVTFKTNLSLITAQVYATLESSIEPSSDHLAKVIDVTIESCPHGFMLGKDTCVCRPELNVSSITCDINSQNITRHGNMWIGYKNDSDCLIVHRNCPFDYCNNGNIQFKVTSPDPQCLYKRSGMLCGQCTNGLSLMLGSSQCGQCSNDHIALVIPFAVAGIALVAFVIALNLTVSVGTINGLIFYANVVKICEPIFFPSGSVPFLSQFISWLNLDLGINTCFYHNMDSCSKMWLQFIFPAYVWFLLILIIILSRYSSKMVRLVGRQAIPVLATMILLSYTKLIRAVFQALYFTNIRCNGNTFLRWTIDANIQYVGGCHIPLFLFSLVVLILLIVPYTFYLLTIPLFEGPLSKYMFCCQKLSTYMKPFCDAYGGPYKDKCRFWTGFLLLVRVIIALVVSLDTDDNVSLDVLTSLLIVIIIMYLLFEGVYRQFPLLCLEEFFILNLMLMVNVNQQTSEKTKRQVLSIILISLSFVVFCGIILYHIWDHLIKSRSQKPIAKVKKIFKIPPPHSCSDDFEFPSARPGSSSVESKPATTSVLSMNTFRESILFEGDN